MADVNLEAVTGAIEADVDIDAILEDISENVIENGVNVCGQERIVAAIIRIESHAILRDEIMYFCQFQGHWLETGRFVSSHYLRGRETLIARYWEEKLRRETRELDIQRQAAVLHETALLVIRD